MSEYYEAGHLGGYKIGGDDATYYPALWKWMVDDLLVESVLDIGCGEGHALEFFRGLGARRSIGVDGVPQNSPGTYVHDFTKGRFHPGGFDAVWCCEFVEHIEEQYVGNFIDCFRSAPMVFMTHAVPGQAGYHHVNCRDAEYWKGALAAGGFVFDAPLTAQAREKAALNTNPWNHFKRSGLVFIR